MLNHRNIFKMPHWPIPRGDRRMIFCPERMINFLALLGNPHLNLPPVIHVAGTNGKGSTCAYLEKIFQQAGYLTHKYISPHLIEFSERIIIHGEKIADDILYALAEECRLIEVKNNISITFIEGATILAFLAFSRIPADIVILETCMGGLFDGTNVIPSSLISVITSIGYDHMEYLGDTLTKIAYEKAGIIKPNQLSVYSWQNSEVIPVLRQKAYEQNTIIYGCGDEWTLKKNPDCTFTIFIDNQEILLPQPSLMGVHQYLNASTAAVTAYLIRHYYPKINIKVIAEGLKTTYWPSRMEKITKGVLRSILPTNMEIILDGAHNEGGAQMLRASIDEIFYNVPLYLIHGRTRNRDIKAFLQYFNDCTTLLCAIYIRGEPESENPDKIVVAADELGINALSCDSIREAVEICRNYHINKYNNQAGLIVICGSLYLTGDVLLANKE